MPLTAAQFHSIEVNNDESFLLDGKEIQQVMGVPFISTVTTYFQIEFIGEIIEVNETATTITYKIDDRTGPWVEVRKWVDDQVSINAPY